MPNASGNNIRVRIKFPESLRARAIPKPAMVQAEPRTANRFMENGLDPAKAVLPESVGFGD